MTTNARRLIAVGIATLLVGIIVLFPARAAVKWFAPDGFAISGTSGTVWYGRARHLQGRNVYVADVSWRIRPLMLFTGKLAYVVEGNPAGGLVNGELALGFGGSVEMRELAVALPLRYIEAAIGVRGIDGNASARFERLVIEDGIPVAADGYVEIAGLILPAVTQSSVGGYRADFYTQQNGVVAAVEDTDGQVDLAGSLTIAEDGTYEFLGRIAPKSDTSEAVLQQLQYLGSADERGQRELRLEGSF